MRANKFAERFATHMQKAESRILLDFQKLLNSIFRRYSHNVETITLTLNAQDKHGFDLEVVLRNPDETTTKKVRNVFRKALAQLDLHALDVVLGNRCCVMTSEGCDFRTLSEPSEYAFAG
jgi:hypothetical protein